MKVRRKQSIEELFEELVSRFGWLKMNRKESEGVYETIDKIKSHFIENKNK